MTIGAWLATRYRTGGTAAPRWLARLVAHVARARGQDAVTLALEVASETDRHDALVRLVEATVVHSAEHTAASAAPAAWAPADREGGRLRDGFPAGPDDGRRLALTTLRDYLRSDPDPQQLQRVVRAATIQLRADVRARAPGRIRDVLAVLEESAGHAPPELRPLLAAPRRDALDAAVLADLAEATLGAATAPAVSGTHAGAAYGRVADVLEPFGACALDALVAALANEPRRTVRGVLVEALRILDAAAGRGLDPDAVRVFGRLLGDYPIGSLVLLDTGEVAVVVRQHERVRDRPAVLVLLDATGTPTEVEERDLAGDGGPPIVRRLDARDVGLDLAHFVVSGEVVQEAARAGGLVHEPSPGEEAPEGYVDVHREAPRRPEGRPDPDVAPPLE